MHKTLAALVAAIPESGSRKASAKEIGEALQLSPEDLARFMPLVVGASITNTIDGGTVSLQMSDEFRFRPVPEARELIIKMVLKGTVSPGKLEVDEGLAVVVNAFVKTNIKVIEDAVENNVAGVRVIAGLGTEFFPLV
jgi:hypothetical protein